MQCACAVLSSVDCSAIKYFSTFTHTRHDFRGGGEKSLNIKRLFRFSLQILPEKFFFLKRTARDVIKILRWCSRKSRFLVRF